MPTLYQGEKGPVAGGDTEPQDTVGMEGGLVSRRAGEPVPREGSGLGPRSRAMPREKGEVSRL